MPPVAGTLSAFLIDHLDALLITSGKESDVLNAIFNDYVANDNRTRLIYIIDLPRQAGAAAPYQCIEKLLNGTRFLPFRPLFVQWGKKSTLCT